MYAWYKTKRRTVTFLFGGNPPGAESPEPANPEHHVSNTIKGESVETDESAIVENSQNSATKCTDSDVETVQNVVQKRKETRTRTLPIDCTASGDSPVPERGKEMKQKLRFLRRRNTDTQLGMLKSSKNKEKADNSKPTLQDIISWSKSFEVLLHDKHGLNMFRDFLRTEFSDENIDFWIACEEYRLLKPAKFSMKAQEIYNEFIAVQAPREVNLDSKTRDLTVKDISNPQKHTFEQAQKRIQALMEKDSFGRFLRSDVYMQLLQDYGGSNS